MCGVAELPRVQTRGDSLNSGESSYLKNHCPTQLRKLPHEFFGNSVCDEMPPSAAGVPAPSAENVQN